MGSGYRGNFGKTKGSKNNTIAASSSESLLVIKTLGSASIEIKNIAEKAPLSISKNAVYDIQSKNGIV